MKFITIIKKIKIYKNYTHMPFLYDYPIKQKLFN